MDVVRLLYRYVTAVAVAYLAPDPLEDELVAAHLTPGDDDVMHLVVGWLAAKSAGLTPKPAWALDKRLVLEYKFKGNGPYAIYFEPGEEAVFPPPHAETMGVDDVIVMAESPREDVTDIVKKYAGPDGKFGGRIDRKDASANKFDLRIFDPLLEKDEVVTISYADGSEISLKFL